MPERAIRAGLELIASVNGLKTSAIPSRFIGSFCDWHRRSRDRYELATMSPQYLKDIGYPPAPLT